MAVVTLGSAAVVASSTPPSTPVSNLHVTLKGKKYTLDEPLTTVADLQAQLEAHSGIVPAKQGKILHEGKKLSASSGGPSLSEAGVCDGDQLNCIPSKKKSSSSSSSSKKASTSTVAATTTTAAAPAASAGGGLDEMLKKLMAGGMPPGMGGNGANGAQPDMKEQMTMLKELISSPIFTEYMSSPEKLEEARQMILTNPMLKGMLAGMPGMGQLLESPDSWAQAMMAAGSMMQSMDVDEMLQMAEQTQAAMGGMGGLMGGGAGGAAAETAGLFGDGNIPKASTTTALDELSEDDE